MLPSHHIPVRADQNEQVRCVICDRLLLDAHIAMLCRFTPGGAMDPFCGSCAYEIVSSTKERLEAVEDVLSFLN